MTLQRLTQFLRVTLFVGIVVLIVFGALYLLTALTANSSGTDVPQTTYRFVVRCTQAPDNCTKSDKSNVPLTLPLANSETLEVDIVVRPGNVPSGRLAANISYNPILLTGEDIDWHIRNADRAEFLPQRGLVTLSAPLPQEQRGEFTLATLRFTVSRISSQKTILQLRDASDNGRQSAPSGGTAALRVQFAESTVTASSADSSAASSSPPPPDPAFAKVQVRHPVATIDGNNVVLHWRRPDYPDFKGYKILYGTGSSAYTESLYTGIQNTSYTFRNLREGVTYYFAIRAVQGNGAESALSNETSTTVGRQEYIPADR